MTTAAPQWRTPPHVLTGFLTAQYRWLSRALAPRYRRLRAVHPSYLLGWLRSGVLICIAASALLYLWVATQASSDIAAANKTEQSLVDIRNAGQAMTSAQRALEYVANREDITLVGAGSDFVNRITLVNRYITLAAEGNAAGTEGTAKIQYVQNQLAQYLQLSEKVVHDYGIGTPLGEAGLSNALSGQDNVQKALDDLYSTEHKALRAQQSAWALAPGTSWWALLGPVIVMLLLVAATVIIVARHFRRHVSQWLWGSLLTVTAATVTAGFFAASDAQNALDAQNSMDARNALDARALPSVQWASHPATMTIALLMLAAAAVQAYLAYYPRLAEYRFQPS